MITATSRAPAAEQTESERSEVLALTAICAGFLMITLDATIVNVALGPIVKALGGSLSGAQWIVSGYTITFASLLLSAGALADRVGARRGFEIGLCVFASGSALSAAAVSLPMLIGARALQGVGAAWLMPCSLALIGHIFNDVHSRRRALGIWGGASGVGLALGPVMGGVLTGVLGWRAIFVVNLPVAGVAWILLANHVPETPRRRNRLDPLGQGLAVVALISAVGGLITAGDSGWGNSRALVLLMVGVAAGLAFAVSQRRGSAPMLDRALLRAPELRIAVTVGLIFNLCLYGTLFCLALYLHAAFGLDSFDTGLAMVPITVVTGLTAYASGSAVKRVGEWTVMIAGLGCGVAVAAGLAVLPSHAGVAVLVVVSAPLGLTALAMPAMTAVVIAHAPTHRIGLASGLLNAARQAGGAIGVAVLGSFLGAGGSTESLTLPLSIVSGLYVAGCCLALTGLLNHRTRTGASDEH